jgi:hypothetical protein
LSHVYADQKTLLRISRSSWVKVPKPNIGNLLTLRWMPRSLVESAHVQWHISRLRKTYRIALNAIPVYCHPCDRFPQEHSLCPSSSKPCIVGMLDGYQISNDCTPASNLAELELTLSISCMRCNFASARYSAPISRPGVLVPERWSSAEGRQSGGMWRSENRAAYQLAFDEDYTPKRSFGRPRSHTYARTYDIQQKLVKVRPAESHITYLISHSRPRGNSVGSATHAERPVDRQHNAAHILLVSYGILR